MQAYISHAECQADECAFCGSIDNLITVRVPDNQLGDTRRIIACSSCDFFKFDLPIKVWLRYLRNEGHWRWYTIVGWQKGQHTRLAELVQQVSEEPEPLARAGGRYRGRLV